MTGEVDLVTALYRAYNARDAEGWLGAFARDSVWRNVPTGEVHVGSSGQEANYAAWNGPFPNGKCENLVIRAGDGFTVAEFRGVGLHEGPLETPEGTIEATGKPSDIAFCDVHVISDGKIQETHRYWDLAGANAQLGL